MDLRVLLATTAVSILTASIFGLLPAVRCSSVPLQEVLKEEAGSILGGFHKSRLSSSLVVAQIALSLLLLVCAGLFTRSLRKAEGSDAGFDAEHVLLVSYQLAPAGYSVAGGTAFDREAVAKLAALPGVESVTLADFSPLSFSIHSDFVELEGHVPQPHESMEIGRAYVGPGYFHTLRTSLVSGRDFTTRRGRSRSVWLSSTRRWRTVYWPGQDVIGKASQRPRVVYSCRRGP